MNNLLSYCGLVKVGINASENDSYVICMVGTRIGIGLTDLL